MTTKKQIGYVVVVRPSTPMTEDEADRRLRGFLKTALRSFHLKAITVDREASEDQTKEATP